MEEIDIVGTYVETKKQIKALEERLAALEVVLLNDESFRNDERIKVSAGRKTITITDECYELLESVGEETYVIEKRRKKLEEFDVDVQKIITNNPLNFTEKLSKESVRIK
jgi:hypothetical protein